MEALKELELHAYNTVLKAFMAGHVEEWDREEVTAKLRTLWQIDNDVHLEILRQLRTDPEVQAIREGRALPLGARPSRAKSFKMPSQPSFPLATAPSGARKAAERAGRGGAEASTPSPAASQQSHSDVTADSQERRRTRAAARGRGGSGEAQQAARTPRKRQAGPLATAPSLARRSGPVRPPGTSPTAPLVRSASTRQHRPVRPRSSSFMGVADPRGYVGRRVWRNWPNESPPWVEGVVYDYDQDTDTYTILYDPNSDPESGHAETMEANYAFANPDDYVLCEKIDFFTMPGSRRQQERPTPESPPAPQPLPSTLTGAPSKKRKSHAPMPVPHTAPFDPGYLASRLQLAGEEELAEMVVVLERRERQLEEELGALDGHGVSDEELARRAELERKLTELSDREYDLMMELRRLQTVEL